MIIERSIRFFGINFKTRPVEGTDAHPYEEVFYRLRPTTRKLLGIIGASTPRYLITITDREVFVTKDLHNPRTGESRDVKQRDISHDRLTGESRSFEFFHRGRIAPKTRFRSTASASSQHESL